MTPQPGDVVLVSRGSGLFDRLVRWATTSYFFHAALVADGGDVIEARLRGVSRRPLSEYAGRYWAYSVAGATQAQREAAVEFCQAKVGTSYGWGDIVADALRLGLHVNTGYRWRTWKHLDCSCLVAAAYADAGLWTTLKPAPSPADLGWSPVLSGPRPWRE